MTIATSSQTTTTISLVFATTNQVFPSDVSLNPTKPASTQTIGTTSSRPSNSNTLPNSTINLQTSAVSTSSATSSSHTVPSLTPSTGYNISSSTTRGQYTSTTTGKSPASTTLKSATTRDHTTKTSVASLSSSKTETLPPVNTADPSASSIAIGASIGGAMLFILIIITLLILWRRSRAPKRGRVPRKRGGSDMATSIESASSPRQLVFVQSTPPLNSGPASGEYETPVVRSDAWVDDTSVHVYEAPDVMSKNQFQPIDGHVYEYSSMPSNTTTYGGAATSGPVTGDAAYKPLTYKPETYQSLNDRLADEDV